LLDLLDFDGGFRIQAQFFGLIVEGQLVKIVGVDRPLELIPEVFDQRRKTLDGTQTLNVNGAHGFLSVAAVYDRRGCSGAL